MIEFSYPMVGEHTVRTVMREGCAYFAAEDVCKAAGIKQAKATVKRNFPNAEVYGVKGKRKFTWVDIVNIDQAANFLMNYKPKNRDFNYLDILQGLEAVADKLPLQVLEQRIVKLEQRIDDLESEFRHPDY